MQEAEGKVKNMEEEICRLQKTLEERNGRLQASASAVEKVPRPKFPLLFLHFRQTPLVPFWFLDPVTIPS